MRYMDIHNISGVSSIYQVFNIYLSGLTWIYRYMNIHGYINLYGYMDVKISLLKAEAADNFVHPICYLF